MQQVRGMERGGVGTREGRGTEAVGLAPREIGLHLWKLWSKVKFIVFLTHTVVF